MNRREVLKLLGAGVVGLVAGTSSPYLIEPVQKAQLQQDLLSLYEDFIRYASIRADFIQTPDYIDSVKVANIGKITSLKEWQASPVIKNGSLPLFGRTDNGLALYVHDSKIALKTQTNFGDFNSLQYELGFDSISPGANIQLDTYLNDSLVDNYGTETGKIWPLTEKRILSLKNFQNKDLELKFEVSGTGIFPGIRVYLQKMFLSKKEL